MASIKIGDLVEDDIGQQSFGSDRGAVIKCFTAELLGRDLNAVAQRSGRLKWQLDTQKGGDVLIGMKAIGDEERDHDDVRAGSELVPVGDERGFFHVGVEDGGIAGARGGDELGLVANGLG